VKRLVALFKSFRVEWLAALVMLALAWLALTGVSRITMYNEDLGFPRVGQALFYSMGAALSYLSRSRDWAFYVSTMPLVGHLIIALIIVLDSQAGYQTAVFYTAFLLLLWLEYAR